MSTALDLHQQILAVLSGGFSGFSLGLIGGGGSVLAVPMLIYFVGMKDAHLAIGTSALAVSFSAFINLVPHARAGHVRWRTAGLFACAGVLGAFAGSSLGKMLDGQKLLFLFALAMMTVAILMARPRPAGGYRPECLKANCLMLVGGTGLSAGGLAGFFGIGGGFLVVPGLILSTGMPIIQAVGSSLVSVGAFGLTTAGNYAFSGLVDWTVAAEFIGGGIAGGWGGMVLAKRLSTFRRALNLLYAVAVFSVGAYVMWRNIAAFHGPG